MPVEVAVDGPHDVLGPDRGEDVERVLGVRELGVDDRPFRRLPQPLDELARDVDADQRVVAAVDTKKSGASGVTRSRGVAAS